MVEDLNGKGASGRRFQAEAPASQRPEGSSELGLLGQ